MTPTHQDKPIPTQSQLQAMIDALPDNPRSCLLGRSILSRLLEKKSPQEFLRIVGATHEAMLSHGELTLNDLRSNDLKDAFDRTYMGMFHRAKGWVDRRHFLKVGLGTYVWMIPGMLYLSEGILGGITASLEDANLRTRKPEGRSHDVLDRAQEALDRTHPLSNTLIGAALVNEGIQHHVELQMEQLATAVGQLAERLHQAETEHAEAIARAQTEAAARGGASR